MSFELVVVGTSLGGLKALSVLLSGLPKDFVPSVVLVHHRSKDSYPPLADCLTRQSGRTVAEPDDKTPISSGGVFLAPADYHLLVDDGCFALSTEAPVSCSRPSIDVLFQSAAQYYGHKLIGVILTGSNEDGALGALTIEQHGGMVIIQDPSDAEANALPDSALRATREARVMPLPAIAPYLVSLCHPPGKQDA